jgi:hypothetical protein
MTKTEPIGLFTIAALLKTNKTKSSGRQERNLAGYLVGHAEGLTQATQ